MMHKLCLSIAILISSWSWRSDDVTKCRAFTATSPWPTKLQVAPSPSLLFAEMASSLPIPSTTGTISAQDEQDEDDSTVVSISNPKTGQLVTLVGTAHLSEKSNRQVRRLIETLQPNAVMIEIDPSRLERLGFNGVDEINLARVTDSEDIEIPTAPRKSDDDRGGLLGLAREASIGVFSQVARALLTRLYKSLENDMDQKAGGEFLQAVRSAEACDACDTLILGDRNSVSTISRVAELAIDNGDFMGVLKRLQAVNQEEIDKFEPRVRRELLRKKGQEGNDYYDLDRTELTTAIIEALKEDETYRTRLFARLEEDVPEFYRAFLEERDYLMSESIVRELDRRPGEVRTVVGVVGLAHVPGMERHFRSVFADRPAPLVEDINTAPSYDE